MFIVLLILGIILFILLKPYFFKYDTVISFTGGLGSGKSFISSLTACQLLKKQRFRTRFYNFFHMRHKKQIPLLYSSIPLRISLKEYSVPLTINHLLLQEKIVEGSVVFLDEIDLFANQFEFKNPNFLRNNDSEGAFDEFVRLFRHYTKGGYLIVNTQCTENIVLTIRRRINRTYSLADFRLFPSGKFFLLPLFYVVKVREISLTEELKSFADGDLLSNYRFRFGFCPLLRRYDTYCYSERYNSVPPSEENEPFSCLKTHNFLRAPYSRFTPKTK